jgi:hypothetical protein
MRRIASGFVVAVLFGAACSPAPPAGLATNAEPTPTVAALDPLAATQLPPEEQLAEIAASRPEAPTPEDASELAATVARLSDRVRMLEEELARRDAQPQPVAAAPAEIAGATAPEPPPEPPRAQPTADPPQRDRTFTPTPRRARANWPEPLPRGHALRELIDAACPAPNILGTQRADTRSNSGGCKGVQQEAYRGLQVRQINTPAKRAVRIRCSGQSYDDLARWNTRGHGFG